MSLCGCGIRWVLSFIFIIIYAQGWLWSHQMINSVDFNAESDYDAFDVIKSEDHCHFKHTIGNPHKPSMNLCPRVRNDDNTISFNLRNHNGALDAYGCPCIQRVVTPADHLHKATGQTFLKFPKYIHCHIETDSSMRIENTTFLDLLTQSQWQYWACLPSYTQEPPSIEKFKKVIHNNNEGATIPVHVYYTGETTTSNEPDSDLEKGYSKYPILGFGNVLSTGNEKFSIPSIFFDIVYFSRCWKAPMPMSEIHNSVYYKPFSFGTGSHSKTKYFLQVTNTAYVNKGTWKKEKGVYCSMEYFINPTPYWKLMILISSGIVLLPVILNLIINDDCLWCFIISRRNKDYFLEKRPWQWKDIIRCSRNDVIGNISSCVYIASNMVMNLLIMVMMQTLPHQPLLHTQIKFFFALIGFLMSFFAITTGAWIAHQWSIYIDKRKSFWSQKLRGGGTGTKKGGSIKVNCFGDPIGVKQPKRNVKYFQAASQHVVLRTILPCIWGLWYKCKILRVISEDLDIDSFLEEEEEAWNSSDLDYDDINYHNGEIETKVDEIPVASEVVYAVEDANDHGSFDSDRINDEDELITQKSGVKSVQFLGFDLNVQKECNEKNE